MIRPATPEDSATVTALAVAAGMFSADDTSVTDTMMHGYFAGAREQGHRCLMDEAKGEAVGVAYFLPKPATSGTWELLMIAIRPDHQGQGRGQKLMQHIEDTLQASGQRLLLVETSGTAEYAQTRKFYEKCGYHAEARVRDYYESGADMVLYCKVLNQG